MSSLLDALKSLKRPSRRRARRSSVRSLRTLRSESLEKRALLTAAISSGDWHDPSIWDDGVPDAGKPAIISNGVTVALDGADHVAKDLVIHGDLVVPEDASVPNKTLTTDWIHVNSDGEFIVGSETDRYDEGAFTLTLTGTDKNADHQIATAAGDTIAVTNNDGFLMTGMGGRIQFYGNDKLSFTKLARTAGVGDTAIVVENVIERNYNTGAMLEAEFVTSAEDDGAVNWEVGDEIVIASSSYDYREESVRTITAIVDNADGTSSLTLDQPLTHRHYGEIEVYGEHIHPGTSDPQRTYEIDMRAEVALLSRNIKIQGLASQDTDSAFGDRENALYEARVRAAGLSDNEANAAPDLQLANGIGAHIMFMPGSGQILVDGVQLDGMGQASQKGRYPIHWHLGGDRSGDLLRNSSVTNSNNRGVTIHGTSNVRVEGVVLHDIHGHGFFFEDAVETGNELIANLALGIHTVGGNDKDFASPGKRDPFIVDTHDSILETHARFQSSAAFWITNPTNTFVGNIAAGVGDSRGLEDIDYADPGPSGTGFWFAIPRTALGISGQKEEYAGLYPIFAEFGQFDYNASHSAAVGLNFDRGSDIEDANFDSNFDFNTIHRGNDYSPRVGGDKSGADTVNYVNGFTNYKAVGAAVYHRGRGETIRFNDLRIADSYNAAWAVSETEFNESLYVGHSRGNGDESSKVGGPRLYDGAGLHTASHFAGFAGENAFTFQVEGSSFGPTMYHAFRDTSFENDQTYDHLAHAVSDFQKDRDADIEHDLGQPSQWIKAVLDLDGTLTGAAGGGSGYSIVPNIDFLAEVDDVQLAGWDAWLTDDIYARVKIHNNDDGSDRDLFPSKSTEPLIRFTARDDDSIDVMGGQNNGNGSWIQVAAKSDEDGFVEGTFTIEFGKNGVPKGGFVLDMRNQDGDRPDLNPEILDRVNQARIVVKIVAAANYIPSLGTEVDTEQALRSATEGVVYFRDNAGNLFFNTGITDDQPKIRLAPPADPLQTTFVSRVVRYGTVIEAEEFDAGVDGIAYHDTDADNSLGSFRNDTGVDATPTMVGDIADGEWLEYTAEIVGTGYNIGVNVASTQAGGLVRVLAANSSSAGYLRELGTVDVPDTGGEFSTLWIESVDLKSAAGPESVIRLEFVGGGFQVDSVQFVQATQTAFPEGGRTIMADPTPTRIELEQYDRGGQGVAYFDDSPGNASSDTFRTDEDVDANSSLVAGRVFEGEWLEYTTDIQAGVYDITLRKSWGGSDAGVKLFVAESNASTEFTELGQLVGGEELQTLESIDLTRWAGAGRAFRVEIVGNWMGLDYLDFSLVASTQSSYVPNRGITTDGTTRIELEQYDEGGQNVAYYDDSPGNARTDANFRLDEDVDASRTLVTNEVFEGEWLEYTTDVEAGAYDITLRKAWGGTTTGVNLYVGDSNSALSTELHLLGQLVGEGEFFTMPNVDLSPWAGINRVIRVEIVGNWMGLDYLDFAAADRTAPTADIVDVTPDPRNTNAGVVIINFDEDVTGVDNSDLTLTRNGMTVDISGLSLMQISPLQYSIDLSTVTTDSGSYELKINSDGSGIRDRVRNTMTTDAVDHFIVEQVDLDAPQIESVVVNDGGTQRSMVTGVTVTFSEEVTGVDANAFVLMNTTTNTQVMTAVTTGIVDGKMVATLTFEGSGIIGGSLADGNYAFTTLADAIRDSAGNQLDGNRDGTGGDDAVDEFFRYFGDVDGDRDVDSRDYRRFRSAYATMVGESIFDTAFDFDGDGDVDARDFQQFRSRYRSFLDF